MCNYNYKLIDYMVKATPRTIVGLVLLSVMYLVAFLQYIPAYILIIWAFLQALFIYLRYVNSKKLEKYLTLDNEAKVKKHVFIFLLAIIYSTVVWNVAFVLSIIYSPKDYEFIALAMSMGILTAGVVSISSMYRIFVIYFILMMLPLAAIMFYIGEHSHITVLLFLSIYVPTILLLAKTVNRSIIESSNINDLLELKVNELKELSVTDSLTNLYNRRYFFETAKNIIELSKREEIKISLLMIDIDYFKKVNDTYGHQVGDMVLVDLTKEISSMTRASDIFARIGGEEFALLLYNTSIDDARDIAIKICENTEQKQFTYNDTTVDITTSIGVSALGDSIDSLEMLYKEADSKLYEAKASGRNRVV